MSAVTITVLRFSISLSGGVEDGLGQLQNTGKHPNVTVKESFGKSYLLYRNVQVVQTWLTRDQRHASDTRKGRMKRESNFEEQLSEVPCRVNSDAHEWRNDWGTVSGSSSVKIQYR